MLINIVKNINTASKRNKSNEEDLKQSKYWLNTLEILITLSNEVDKNYTRRSPQDKDLVMLSFTLEKEKKELLDLIQSYICVLEEPHRFFECSKEFQLIVTENLDLLKEEIINENSIIDKIMEFLRSMDF